MKHYLGICLVLVTLAGIAFFALYSCVAATDHTIDKVRDALASLDVVTFWGPVKFGPNGQINSLEPPVFQIQNAKPVVLFPQAIKQGELKLGVN